MRPQAYGELGGLDDRLAPDILKGASEIARFLFGQEAARRQVYNLHETGALPTFRLGRIICARRSTLHSWIEQQESNALDHSQTSEVAE